MKRLSIALICALMFAACVNEEFDLSKVDSNEVTIGTDDSVFEMPLVNITVKTSALHSGEIGIEEIFEEVDIWLPTPLPANANCVDLKLLESNEEGYRDNLINALITQMETDLEKRREVADHLEEDYAASFDDLIPDGVNMSISDFIFEHYTDEGVEDYLRERISYLAHDYLIDVSESLDSVDCNIGAIDLDSSIIDMLTQNAGTRENPSLTNYLAIYGTIDSKIPIDAHSAVTVEHTGIVLELDVHHNQRSNIPECYIYGDDLHQLTIDTHLTLPVGLDHYYPGESFPQHEETALVLKLSVRKKGGLTIPW